MRTSSYITPLAEQKVARLPRKRRAAQGTPEGRQRRTSRPLQSRKSRACHAKGAQPKGRQRDARGTPEAYITPLAEQKVARLPRKRCAAQGTPNGRQRDARGVHHALCRAEGAPATQRRAAQGTPEGCQRRTSRPLQSRKSRACHAKGAQPKGRQRDARGVHHAPCREKVAHLPHKRHAAQGTPEGRQRRTSRPLQSRKSRACHAKGAQPKGRQRGYAYMTPLAEQKVARLPRKRRAAQGTPEGRQRRTSRPLQSRKSRACHAKGECVRVSV